MKMFVKTLLLGALLPIPALVAGATPPADAPPADSQIDMVATAPSQDPGDRNCLRYTGSYIIASENRRNARQAAASGERAKPVCNGSAGRSYSQDDLRNTGAIDLADALRRLDPAVH